MSDPERGNRPQEYKEESAELRLERDRVRYWRKLIERAVLLLDLKGRAELVATGDKYLDGTMEVAKRAQKAYCNYLLPHLEEEHRQTLPDVPQAEVTARTERGQQIAPMIRRFIDQSLRGEMCQVKPTCQDLLWDDDRWGVAFAKTRWVVDTQEADPPTSDINAIAQEIDRASAENQSLETLVVAESDLDHVHIRIHQEHLAQLPELDPGRAMLEPHIADHEARTVSISREHALLERVDVDRMAYDPDVPWPKRRWEAELKRVRVKTLLDRGYKNVNPFNLPADPLPELAPAEVPYEDQMTVIWEVHDIRNNLLLVISARGPEDGLFLHQAPWPYQGVDIYLPLVFRPTHPGRLHGASTVQQCLPVLERLATVDFYINRHVENHAGYKPIFPKGAWDSNAKAQFNNPDAKYLELIPEAVTLFKEYKPPPIPETLLEYRNLLLGELRRLVGADAQNVGADPGKRMTATESFARSTSYRGRKEDRQEIMGVFLGQVAQNFLAIYRSRGFVKQPVRFGTEQGLNFEVLDPQDIPSDLEVHLDIASVEEAGPEELTKLTMGVDMVIKTGMNVSLMDMGCYVLRRMGFPDIEAWRLDQPMGPVNPGGMKGVSGIAQATNTGEQPAMRGELPKGPTPGGPKKTQQITA